MYSTILAANGLSIAINLLLVINVAVCLLLCLLVLMQLPKQEGLGAAFGGGMTDQAFGARTTDVLQKGTVYLGTVFFVVTLALSILVIASNADNKFETQTKELAEEQVNAPKTAADVNALVEEEEAASSKDSVEKTSVEETSTELTEEGTPAEATTPAIEETSTESTE